MSADNHVGANKFGLDAEMYTGKDTKDRGESMVSKHLEKMQAEKENMAIEKLSALMPQMGAAVRVVALRQAVFDVDTAVGLLRRFHTENEEALKALQKKRGKLRQQAKEEEQAAKEREASSSGSGSGSEDDSASDSGSGSESDRKSKRRSKRSKSGKRKRSSGDKDKKRKKRSKGDKAKAKASLTAGESFGKYGIIRETDFAAKSSEFILWALEVKKVDVETLPRTDERELFRDYIEDYNTGTLPHRKYYNLEAYEKYKEAKAASKGIKKSTKKDALDDEQELRRQRAEEAAKLREQRMKEAYDELKHSDKAKDMKEQEMLRLQMQAAYKAGDLATAERIMKRLAPDDAKK